MKDKNLPPSADRIRIDIDRGLKGDKTPHADPAAAPLGTDAEAASASPTLEERAIAAKQPNFPSTRDDGRLPDGGAVLSLRAVLVFGVLVLISGALLVLLRLHQAG